jgi:hypothetical protein
MDGPKFENTLERLLAEANESRLRVRSFIERAAKEGSQRGQVSVFPQTEIILKAMAFASRLARPAQTRAIGKWET